MPTIPYSAQVMVKYAADTAAAGTNAGASKAAGGALQPKAPEGAGKPLAARLVTQGAVMRTPTISRGIDQTRGVSRGRRDLEHPLALVKTGQPYWVHVHHCFYTYAFARDTPVEERTSVQQTALEDFYMMDWYCDILRKLARVKDATNAEKNRLMSLKRDDLPYEPKTRALLMQFREVHNVARCEFVDKCWTLDMRLGDKTEPTRSTRLQLEKLIIELFATPRLYRTRLHHLGLTPATFFSPMHWDPLTAANATMDTVVASFVHLGVSEALVDDAYKFGQTWLHDWTYRPVAPPGWTTDKVANLINVTAGRKEPAGFFRAEDDLYPRPPMLAWASSADNVIVFQLSHLQDSELAGIRRQPNSAFQKQLDGGLKLPPHENRNVLRLANPYPAENKACAQQARSGTAPRGGSGMYSGRRGSGMSMPMGRRGRGRGTPCAMAPGPTPLGQGIHPSMTMPNSFAHSNSIMFFDPTRPLLTRTADNQLSLAVRVSIVMGWTPELSSGYIRPLTRLVKCPDVSVATMQSTHCREFP
ncbi:hypothetical protein B0H17DRAFT_1148097 [Mycena rosella]|uniref:Uncharacterized protein n=1 Tax=Mycena rosella TaxID=1033263 RepID=A0AAD7G1A8_MYCRO|nr:hypothetical protein B0H17DRAFT_1148097 [Mycena rosella]